MFEMFYLFFKTLSTFVKSIFATPPKVVQQESGATFLPHLGEESKHFRLAGLVAGRSVILAESEALAWR